MWPSVTSKNLQALRTESPKANEENDDDLDEQFFEQSLAVFGLNRKGERESQRKDGRKRAKTSKAPQIERDSGNDLFRDSMEKDEKLQAQDDKLTEVMEAMEESQIQQLQLMTQFKDKGWLFLLVYITSFVRRHDNSSGTTITIYPHMFKMLKTQLDMEKAYSSFLVRKFYFGVSVLPSQV